MTSVSPKESSWNILRKPGSGMSNSKLLNVTLVTAYLAAGLLLPNNGGIGTYGNSLPISKDLYPKNPVYTKGIRPFLDHN